MKRFLACCLALILLQGRGFAQQTDLTGLKFCIDPGHGGHNSNDRWLIPDPGVNFYESVSNLNKALWLRQLLDHADGLAVALIAGGENAQGQCRILHLGEAGVETLCGGNLRGPGDKAVFRLPCQNLAQLVHVTLMLRGERGRDCRHLAAVGRGPHVCR